MRSWEDLRAKLDLDDGRKSNCRQIIHTIPCAWKEMFLECGNNISNIILLTSINYQNYQKFQ